MFKLVFGAIWLSFISVFTRIMYSDTGTITVNGEIVSYEEFHAMLWPKMFIGIFWLVGILFFVSGLLEILKNYKTDKYGEPCYGRIINIFNSGSYVNGVPELKANIVIYLESTGTLEYTEEILGLATKISHSKGDYVEGKYYNGDINIISGISENMVPSYIISELNGLLKDDYTEDTIIIDGVEYVKKI